MLIVTSITNLPIKSLLFFLTCVVTIVLLLCKKLVSSKMLKQILYHSILRIYEFYTSKEIAFEMIIY